MADLIRINGHTVEEESGQGIAGLRVEVWDIDHIIGYAVGDAFTDDTGFFLMEFPESYLHDIFGERAPRLYFRIFREETFLKTTEGSLVWSLENGDEIMEIYIPGLTDETYGAFGRAFDEDSGQGRPGLRVEAWDNDDIIGYPIGSIITGVEGFFQMQFMRTFLEQIFEGREPRMYFRIFADEILLLSTQDAIVWMPPDEAEIQIPLPPPENRIFTISGRTFDEESGEGILGLRVELWDRDYIINYPIRTAFTGAGGDFSLGIDEAYLDEIFEGREPYIFFLVFSGEELLANTESSIIWNKETIEPSLIPIPRQPETIYTVSGRVFDDASGQGLAGLLVELRDHDHIIDYAIATLATGGTGTFQTTFTESEFNQMFGDRSPVIYFDVYSGGTLLTSTDDSIRWYTDTFVELQIPVHMAQEQTYIINGQVTSTSGRNVAGLTVEARDNDHIVAGAIGSITTGADGAFQFSFAASYFQTIFGGHDPTLYFKVFSGGMFLTSTENSILWTTTTGDNPVSIPLSDGTPAGTHRACADTATTAYTVTGSVSIPDRASIEGLLVQIVDKGVGQDVILVEALTNPCGDYTASFDPTLITERGKRRPDLQAKVYRQGTFIAASEVRYNAEGNETLDVIIPPDAIALPSEHETLVQALRNHYVGELGALQEDDERQDITYLANKSGWDARAVAQAALAEQFSARSGAAGGDLQIAPEYFYALFRAGIAANEDTLYHSSADAVQAVWESAAAQEVIPASSADEIPVMLDRFRTLSAGRLLTGPAVTGVSALPEMLELSGLNEAQQQTFAQLYVTHRSDMSGFWEAADGAFGTELSQKLQVDGKLAYLTVNNAPLMSAMHERLGGQITDPVQLAQTGFHRASQWEQVLVADTTIPIPEDIPGDDNAARRDNYAQYLAAAVATSYPTASIAQMVNSGELSVNNSGQVNQFLTEHQGAFEFGVQSVDQFIADNEIDAEPEVAQEVQRLQRVYQISPTNETMAALLDSGMDAAAHVAQYDKEVFVDMFAEQLGGVENAEKVHDQSTYVHNVVLNIAIDYLTASNGIALGSPSLAQDASTAPPLILQPAPMGPGSVTLQPPAAGGSSASIPAYPTLESLFGDMDFCDCAHCRSMLSPAAYLVDLLKFIDRPGAGSNNPLSVLLGRRPDIEHLPLTCENTNTALPYIDVVNETLEYYVTHSLSLGGYLGHDTGTMASEDLLASPAFVNETAYTTLANERFPLLLPFHRALENLRRYFEKFGVSLPLAMEKLRRHDNLERGAAEYGWRDILMEELRLSRGEHEVLTDSPASYFLRAYGFPGTSTDPTTTAIATLSNAKAFCRRLEISYEDLVEIVKARFVNPNSDLLPKLERLGVSFGVLKQLKTGALSDAQFNALLPTGTLAPDPAEYGGSITAWVKDTTNYSRIMALITLTDVTLQSDPCSFDALELRRAEPMTSVSDTSTRLGVADFIRILRFIRMWKKLGWTIEQTDAALCALYRNDLAPLQAADVDTTTELDAGFLTLLPRLGIILRVMRALDLSPKNDLRSLLACWSDISTHGPNALYRTMFLNPATLAYDPVYADNGYGTFLTSGSVKIVDHVESLRAAFNLTGEEFDRIFAALGFDANTALSIPNISAIFRRGYLARAMRLSVRELLLLIDLTGLDPFATPDVTAPAILRLIDLATHINDAGLKPTTALYLIWNQDLSGASAPPPAQVHDFMRTLREDFARIENEFAVADDPDGEITRARMTLVYGTEATGVFFSLLNGTHATEADYSHFEPEFGAALADAIQNAIEMFGASLPPLVYDDFRKRLIFSGYLVPDLRDAIKAVVYDSAVVAEVPSGSLSAFQTAFQNAIDALYAANSASIVPFFDRYSELYPLYTTYMLSADPVETKRSTLLADFLPTLVGRRKAQQALQRLADAAKVERAFAETLVNASPAADALHADGDTTRPALDDLLAMETPGLSVQFYDGGVIGVAPHPPEIAANLGYAPASPNMLPANATSPGDPVSGVWSGYIQPPEGDRYNFTIDAEPGAAVTLKIGGDAVPLTQTDAQWRNADPIELKAGTLYTFELTVTNIRDTLRIQWRTKGRGRSVIEAAALYATSLVATAGETYLRFLKAGTLASMLRLAAAEIARPELSGASWLNALPVAGNAPAPATLLAPFGELLDHAWLKRMLSPGSELLLEAFIALEASAPDPLYALTGWDAASVNGLVSRFGATIAGLAHPSMLRRVFDAFTLARTMGVPTAALAAATTNEPAGTIVRDLQSALRARYSAEDWRTVVGPINDQMRGLQRDALVAYVLHKLRTNPSTAQINTPERLFEFFLMDVEMEPCMQTSRIRHALSSVQLFIERCMMNLEPDVSPAALSAKQWEWMKRYRVWEANRKVFLFPENWLEPELRDDKSPFFVELESELLQSDITEDSASIAMLNYLAKLEEVAKLEPCALHHIAADPVNRVGQVDHVIARTPGASRKFYYRRREYGYWTPWEHIKLDIEGEPVFPVVWRDRLLLFWVRIIKTRPDGTSIQKASGGGTLDSLSWPPEPKMMLKVILCWSEYYNGKWQAPKSSDAEVPADLYPISAASQYPFDRTKLSYEVEEVDDALRVSIGWAAAFLFYNTYGEPLRDVAYAPVSYIGVKDRWLFSNQGSLDIDYAVPNGGILTRNVLKPLIPYSLVLTHHPVPDIWHAPFFYRDARHVFYVSSTQQQVPLRLISNYGVPVGTYPAGNIPGTVTLGGAATQSGAAAFSSGALARNADVVNIDAARLFLSEDANIRQTISTSTLVSYNGREIGPAGAVRQG